MIVILNPHEADFAAGIGIARHEFNHDAGIRDANTDTPIPNEESREGHIRGALAELAFSKGMNLYWDSEVRKPDSRPDFPPDIEVRCASVRFVGLTYRFSDERKGKSRRRFVLVIPYHDDSRKFRIAGWLTGNECKIHGEKKDPHGRNSPAYFVSNLNRLRPIKEIMDGLR